MYYKEEADDNVENDKGFRKHVLCMFEIKILWCVYLAFCQKSDIRGSRVQTGNVHDIASSNNALSYDLLRFRTVVKLHLEGGWKIFWAIGFCILSQNWTLDFSD